MLLAAAVKLANITECGWQSNGDISCLDEPIASEIEELLVHGDDDINGDVDYEYGNEAKSDNQQDEFG